MAIARTDPAYWETRTHAWTVEGGTYEIAAAASSITELMTNPVAAAAVAGRILQRAPDQSDAAAEELRIDVAATVTGIPIGKLRSLSGGRGLTRSQLDGPLTQTNDA